MGMHDRQYGRGKGRSGGGPRGFADSLRRIASGAEGFMGWSLPLLTVPAGVPGLGGIHVRVHLLYLLMLAGELLGSLREGSLGPGPVAGMMACLFVLILLHEFGHCLVCRLVGGQADRILMWPLGGLASCDPPHRWTAHLATTLGGPGVNALLLPVFAAALWWTHAPSSIILCNPFRPDLALSGSYFHGSWWHAFLWYAHYTNFLLLAFNMLLPMYPMDCGRVVQELLWSRLGYRRSLAISVNLGLAAAIALGVFAITTGESRLLGIALFAGFTCYGQRQELQNTEPEHPWSFDTDRGYAALDEASPAPAKPSWSQRRAAKAAERRARAEAAHAAEVDRILAKIKAQGMAALTPAERRALEFARDR